MKKVRLPATEVDKDSMALVSLFIKAAFDQNFDLDWVETVLIEAVANHCVNFEAILLGHVEIIQPQPAPPEK